MYIINEQTKQVTKVKTITTIKEGEIPITSVEEITRVMLGECNCNSCRAKRATKFREKDMEGEGE